MKRFTPSCNNNTQILIRVGNVYSSTHSDNSLRRLVTNTSAKTEGHHDRSLIHMTLVSALLITPLPALGQSSTTLTANRDKPVLVADIFNIIQRSRQVIETLRSTTANPQRSRRDGALDRQRTPVQVPSDASIENRQPRQSQSVDPVSLQEQQYVESLSPDARQVYEIIQRAKKDLRQQPMANFLGTLAGMTPKGTAQSPEDLDREFQNAIRQSDSSSKAQSTVTTEGTASGTKSGNRLLQRILNKRSDETHEQWYARIDPVTYQTPGEEYRAWKATLSLADNQAYDALVQKENQERREQFSNTMSDMIRYELSCRWVEKPGGYYGETVQVCGDQN
jgi:hypothetical protein